MDNDIRNRYRGRYADQPIRNRAYAPPTPVTQDLPAPAQVPASARRPKRSAGRRFALAGGLLLLIVFLAAGAAWLRLAAAKNSPVPQNIASSVNYPVYYPDSKKMPFGYSLDPQSFKTPSSNVVVYSVANGDSQKMAVSLETKPSNSQLQSLINRSFPLNSKVQTSLGTATIGSANNQTVALLPAAKALIIVTATQSVDQSDLIQLLKSLKS